MLFSAAHVIVVSFGQNGQRNRTEANAADEDSQHDLPRGLFDLTNVTPFTARSKAADEEIAYLEPGASRNQS